MSRRRRREKPHDLAWHEERLAEPWANYAHANGKPLRRGEYERALEGKRAQMFTHDQQPKRMRELVAEHNVNEGVRRYSEEMRATVQRCQHGRHPPSCAQCTYQKAVAARDGGEVNRSAAASRTAQMLQRMRDA